MPPSVSFAVCLTTCLYVYLFVCLRCRLCIYAFVCLSFCLSLCLRVCVSVCVSLSLPVFPRFSILSGVFFSSVLSHVFRCYSSFNFSPPLFPPFISSTLLSSSFYFLPSLNLSSPFYFLCLPSFYFLPFTPSAPSFPLLLSYLYFL